MIMMMIRRKRRRRGRRAVISTFEKNVSHQHDDDFDDKSAGERK